MVEKGEGEEALSDDYWSFDRRADAGMAIRSSRLIVSKNNPDGKKQLIMTI